LPGLVPAVGDVFDFAWRANKRNLDLLRAHLGVEEEPAEDLSTTQRVLLGLLVMAAVTCALLPIALAAWLIYAWLKP
jgi:hypothetical protein